MSRALKPINHGTDGGYQAHHKRGVPMCDACSLAKATYMAQYRANRADVRANDRQNSRVRTEALRLLVENHRAEYARLLDDARREIVRP